MRVGSALAGRTLLKQFLFGKPPQDLGGIEVIAEPFFDDKNKAHFGKGPKGSLGGDVIIKYNNKIVLGMGLKTGKGTSKSGIGKRIKRMGGADFIQVTIKMDGK